MKIGFVTLDWSNMRDAEGLPTPGGAGWYRCVLPARTLAANGVETVYGPNLGQNKAGEFVVQDLRGEVHEDCDIVVLQRWMDLEAPDCIEIAKAAGQVVINDVDDWYDAIDPANRAFLATHPRANLTRNRAHYKRALAASSALTVSTEYIASKMRGTGKPVIVLENCIDLARWEQRDVSGAPVLGWVGATGYRSGDLNELRGTLGMFLRRHDAAFHHSGSGMGMAPANEELGLADDIRFTSSELTSIAEYPSLFEHFNIGLVPLAPKAFNAAKSHIKGLEYAASGIPFVASPTAEYRRFTATGAGELAGPRPRDWHRKLTPLLDSETRVRAGKQARVSATAYDIADRWVDWQQAYAAVLAS